MNNSLIPYFVFGVFYLLYRYAGLGQTLSPLLFFLLPSLIYIFFISSRKKSKVMGAISTKFIGVSFFTSLTLHIAYSLLIEKNPANSLGLQHSLPTLNMILVSVIITPVSEEFFFRGMIYDLLGTSNRWLSTVICALLFALPHGLNLGLICYFGLGLYFGYLKSRNLKLGDSVVAHIINNIIATVLTFS